MPDDELENIFRNMPERKHAPRTFRLGDRVRVRSGPFAAFAGVVEGINQSRRLLKVKIEIMGRETPIRLAFTEVEKTASL